MNGTYDLKRKSRYNQDVDFPQYIKQKVMKKTPSILENAIAVSGHRKLYFLKNCFERKVL